MRDRMWSRCPRISADALRAGLVTSTGMSEWSTGQEGRGVVGGNTLQLRRSFRGRWKMAVGVIV